MIPLPKQEKTYLSILFSNSDIKVAKIEPTKGKKKLNLFCEIPLLPQLIIDGEVKDTAGLIKAVNDLKSKFKIQETDIIVGIPEYKATIHTLVLPDLSPVEINQAIEYQAESFLPFPYQDEYIDWKFQGDRYKGKVKVLINALPKYLVDGYTNVLKNCGFNPLAFESTSLSLLRLVPMAHRRFSIICEMGETLSSVVINGEGNIETSSVIMEKDQFVPTLLKIKNYYFSTEQPVIYVCGKFADQEAFDEIKKLQLSALPLKSDVLNLPNDRELELAVLFSLAQKKVHPPEDPATINVLPKLLAQQYSKTAQENQTRNINLIFLSFLIVLNIIIYALYFQRQLTNPKISINQIDNKSFSEISSLDKYRDKLKIINTVNNNSILLDKILNEVNHPNNNNISIIGLSYSQDKKEIIITGRATTKDDLLNYKQSLESMKLFSKVTISLPSLKDELNLDFKIIVKI